MHLFLGGFWPMLERAFPILRAIAVALVIFIIIASTLSYMRAQLLAKARTKKQKSNIAFFTRSVRSTAFVVLAIIVASSQVTSFQNLSIAFGFITAALGFALQRPLTGIAAWIMIMVRRPFEIGDRVVIGTARGNIVDITLSHVYLEEVGRYGGEETSDRTVIIPNSTLFEQNITNYSLWSDYVLGQVAFTIPFASDLDQALALGYEAVHMHAGEFEKSSGRTIHYRLAFDPNGVIIKMRYGVPFSKAQHIGSNITKEIFDLVKRSPGVEFAYPHMSLDVRGGAKLGRAPAKQ